MSGIGIKSLKGVWRLFGVVRIFEKATGASSGMYERMQKCPELGLKTLKGVWMLLGVVSICKKCFGRCTGVSVCKSVWG